MEGGGSGKWEWHMEGKWEGQVEGKLLMELQEYVGGPNVPRWFEALEM